MPYEILTLRNPKGHLQVSDEVLEAIWGEIQAEGKRDSLFYMGGVHNAADFIRYIKQTELKVFFVVEKQTSKLRAIAWLSNVSRGNAFVHYCVLGLARRSIARALLDYWCSLRRTDGSPWLQVLVGITPEYHTQALRVIQIVGFQTIGTIPNYCLEASGSGRCGAVISHYNCAAHRNQS